MVRGARLFPTRRNQPQHDAVSGGSHSATFGTGGKVCAACCAGAAGVFVHGCSVFAASRFVFHNSLMGV